VRTRYRIITVSAVAGVAVAALAVPAFAHVEVSADKTQAGAADVTLTFNGEAENPKAGISSERVVLPTGIAPGDVALVKAPTGWKFTVTADGFTVGGKALKTGTDAVWKVKIAKLPDGQTRLSFKTLETYGNGDISRWIEIQQPGQDEPDNPAPLLTLKPGTAAGTPAASSAAASPSPSAQVAAPATTPAQAQTPETTGDTSTWWIWVAVVVLVVAAGILFLRRRRRTPDTE
jgi:LPXTG-motif cell wall-anchored protein